MHIPSVLKLQISSLERVATISFDLVSVPRIRFAVFVLYLQFPFPQQQRTTFPPNANLDALSNQGMQRRLVQFFNALWRNCKKSASSRRMVFVTNYKRHSSLGITYSTCSVADRLNRRCRKFAPPDPKRDIIIEKLRNYTRDSSTVVERRVRSNIKEHQNQRNKHYSSFKT